MNNNLTDSEIVKALECCSTNLIDDCKRCNLRLEDGTTQPFCTTTLIRYALDLINRQKAIIEKSEKVEHFADKTIATQQAEIERLQDAIDEQDIEIASLWKRIEDAKAEAYKEFAERLKDMSEHFWEEKENFVSEEQIDNLLKELSGEYKPPKTETQIKFEAYRECIEKIKQRAEYCSYSVAVNTIADNVLKDLEGENKCE